MTSDNSNVIFYMKLMHELKAEYPNVPDEAVKDTIIKYCGDKELCIRELSAQSLFLSRSKRAMKEGKFSTQRALLTHQMEQCLKLDQELRSERSKLNNIREEIALIEERRNKKRLLKLNAQLKRNEGIEKDIKSLRYSCDTLAAKVTKITKGKVPLGETNVEFYGFLSPKLSDNKKPSLQIKDAKEPLNNLSKLITSLDQDKGNNNNNNNSPINDSESSSNNIIAQWACTECTFLNHPALNHCEECEMPRFSIGCSNQENVQPLSFMGKNSL